MISTEETLCHIIDDLLRQNLRVVSINITPSSLVALLKELEPKLFYIDRVPSPPVSRRTIGLFFEEEVYDHHAPEYLRQVELFKDRLKFNGPLSYRGIKILVSNSGFDLLSDGVSK